MRRAFLAFVGATSLALAACGAEADKDPSGDAPEDVGASEDVGVSTSELTSCNRTELANVVVRCKGLYTYCDFRLMENNFACAEGVVGQASTELMWGTGRTFTTVATNLFGESFEGSNGWGAVTIATQWGHAYASTHQTPCRDGDGTWMRGTWHLDPWSKQPVLQPGGDLATSCLP
jgi:hypothetical protein